MTHHAVLPLRGLYRNVSGANVGTDALRVALQRIPESPAAANLNAEPIFLLELNVPGCFPGGKRFPGPVPANDTEPIRERISAPIKSPRRANCSLHRGLNARRGQYPYFLCYAEAAAKSSGATGILPEFAAYDKQRRSSLTCLDR